MTENTDVRWSVARRFELIEWRAYWLGRVNRSDLEGRFGISTPQASKDLQSYLEAAPGNITYDSKEKAYIPTSDFQPKFLNLSADRYLRQLGAILNKSISTGDTWFGSIPPATVVQTITRNVEPEILRAILRAIEHREELELSYRSFSGSRTRKFAPHSLAFDGHRWHARAWCVENEEFRDFVLSRIVSINDSHTSDIDPSTDTAWNTMAELKISAHPGLNDEQRSTIERDFGMKNGLLSIKTRVALIYYFVKTLNLDLQHLRIPPERQQIILSNVKEIETIYEMHTGNRLFNN